MWYLERRGNLRKLASIQKVLAVRPIEGADKIEVVDVLGWSVVVKKGEFKPGDLCVYLEIDSWLDSSIPAFQADVFVERYTNWGTKRGMRLKTIKLRKQISQGLVLPISDFAELTGDLSEGYDVTEILNIEKWEPAEETQSNGPNKVAGGGKFPSFIRKTDQERVQNYVNELPKHADETFEVTIKLDGSSMTIFHVGKGSEHYAHVVEDMETRALAKKSFFGKLLHKAKKVVGLVKTPECITGVCSRNIELPINEGNHFSTYVREHNLLDKLKAAGKNVAVQGELLAPTIQQNHEKVGGFEFHVFDVFDIDKQEYLKPAAAREIVASLGLDYVPVLSEAMSLRAFEHEADDGSPAFTRYVVDMILAFAEGPGMNPGVKREGVVFKSNQSDFSFKAISNSYLLKKEGK
jgi:RNA ligase (TIGR02306 family)